MTEIDPHGVLQALGYAQYEGLGPVTGGWASPRDLATYHRWIARWKEKAVRQHPSVAGEQK